MGTPCPTPAELERAVSRLDPDTAIAQHLRTCARCADEARAIRENSVFMGGVLRTLGPDLAANTGSNELPVGVMPGYEITREIARGGQGVVFEAMQAGTRRRSAIKLLQPRDQSERARRRLEREGEIAAALRHPGIVTIYESRALPDGRFAVAMEYIDGIELDEWAIAAQKEPNATNPKACLRRALTLFSRVCAAVQHAHHHGVIHRDLKPSNILVDADDQPHVLDFGIARRTHGPDALAAATRTGAFSGTLAYASPEQVSGDPERVDTRADVYALGVILYELVAGRPPYNTKGSLREIVDRIATASPAPLSPLRWGQRADEELSAIIARSLAKERHTRYQTAAALQADIDNYLAGRPVEARSDSGWYLLRRAIAMNRKRLAWAGAAVALLAIAAIAVAVSLSRAAESARREEHQREQARAESVRARAVTELLREALPANDPTRPDLAWLIGNGLGHLYFRLETGAFADDPEVDQALRRMWGEVYTNLGSGKGAALVEYAEVALRSGLSRLRTEHAGDHPEIAAALHELAAVVLLRKRAPEAEPLCRAALEMRERLLGPKSAPTAYTHALLARIMQANGRPADAAREADAALAVLRTRPDTEADLPIAAMVALRARQALDAGDATRAEPLLRESLLRRLRRLSPEEPELGASLRDASEFAAERPESAIADLLREVWGSTPETLRSDIERDTQLFVAPDRGTYYKGVETGRTDALARLLRLQESLLGANDPALIHTLISQLRSAASEHNYSKKIGAALRAASLLESRFGPHDPVLLACIDEAAITFAVAGTPDRAVELARRSCEIHDAIPDRARDTLIAGNQRRYLGLFLALAGRNAEAVPVYRRALDEVRQAVGPEHHIYGLTEGCLAFSLAETGELAEADTLSADALRLTDSLPSFHPDQTANIRFARAHVLLALARAAEARPLFEQSWFPVFQTAEPPYAWRRIFIQDIARACELTADPRAAAAWRAQLDVPGSPEKPWKP